MIDYSLFPSPCYIMEEDLLRRNLRLIQHVADEAGVEIILAFKAFALWKSFPIFREYIHHTTASSLYEARLAFEEFGSKAHTYSPAYTYQEFGDILRCSRFKIWPHCRSDARRATSWYRWFPLSLSLRIILLRTGKHISTLDT